MLGTVFVAFHYKIICLVHLGLNLCIQACIVYLQPFCDTLDFKTIHWYDPYPFHALLAAVFQLQNVQNFIQTCRALIEDILSCSRGFP